MSRKSDALPNPDTKLTPLMRQFYAIKAEHPDKILFFRMGDFYEMFGDDAIKAAPILGITLTSRSHGESERIPLAGVPYHAADRYLAKLLEQGEKVVVVEQVEDPKTARGIVKREIVEILTPGTATIDSPDSDGAPRYLAALFSRTETAAGMAILDLATGMFLVDEGAREAIYEQLRVMDPTEILIPVTVGRASFAAAFGIAAEGNRITECEEFVFDYKTAVRDLTRHFGVSTLDGFGLGESRLAVTAAGAIYRYLLDNHRDRLSHLTRVSRVEKSEVMTLDYNSVRNLELIRNIASNTEEHSLLAVINRCHTPAGSRLLQRSLLQPFKVKAKIDGRLSGVSELVKNRDLCFRIRELTRNLPDLEKFAGRLGIGKLSPRQMGGIRDALSRALNVKRVLADSGSAHLSELHRAMPDCTVQVAMIDTALVEEPPMVSNRGNIFRRGYSERLDGLNDSIHDARTYIASLQKVERERTGIASLKVGFNKVFGYYLEVTRANTEQVPGEYIRKQTLVNAERYITPELKEREELILAAEEKIAALEADLYNELVDKLNERIVDICHTASLLAEIDLVSALSDLAVEKGYCRPEITEDHRLAIENGRHPVIESVLPTGSFVANDLSFRRDCPHDYSDRPEHVGQVNLPSPDRPDCDHGADRIICPRRQSGDWPGRPRLHPGWRAGQSCPRSVDLSG